MKVTITSKNNEKVFNDSSIINIGSARNCQFKLDLGFELVVSLQKLDNGKWQIVNTSKTDKVLFRGQPIGQTLIIGSLCKLMIADSDEFISIKITSGGVNPKVVPGSLELANRKNAERRRDRRLLGCPDRQRRGAICARLWQKNCRGSDLAFDRAHALPCRLDNKGGHGIANHALLGPRTSRYRRTRVKLFAVAHSEKRGCCRKND